MTSPSISTKLWQPANTYTHTPKHATSANLFSAVPYLQCGLLKRVPNDLAVDEHQALASSQHLAGSSRHLRRLAHQLARRPAGQRTCTHAYEKRSRRVPWQQAHCQVPGLQDALRQLLQLQFARAGREQCCKGKWRSIIMQH